MKKIEYYQNETVGASYRHDLSRMTNQTYFFNVEAVPLSSWLISSVAKKTIWYFIEGDLDAKRKWSCDHQGCQQLSGISEKQMQPTIYNTFHSNKLIKPSN